MQLSVLPDGRIFNSSGQDITSIFSSSDASSIYNAVYTAPVAQAQVTVSTGGLTVTQDINNSLTGTVTINGVATQLSVIEGSGQIYDTNGNNITQQLSQQGVDVGSLINAFASAPQTTPPPSAPAPVAATPPQTPAPTVSVTGTVTPDINNSLTGTVNVNGTPMQLSVIVGSGQIYDSNGNNVTGNYSSSEVQQILAGFSSAAVVWPTVSTSGLTVTPGINNSLTGVITINGQPTQVSVLPNGEIFNSSGQDITSTLGSQAASIAAVFNINSTLQTVETTVSTSGLTVTPDINNSLTGTVSVNGIATQLSVLPNGQIYDSNGNNITSTFSSANAQTIITAFFTAPQASTVTPPTSTPPTSTPTATPPPVDNTTYQVYGYTGGASMAYYNSSVGNVYYYNGQYVDQNGNNVSSLISQNLKTQLASGSVQNSSSLAPTSLLPTASATALGVSTVTPPQATQLNVMLADATSTPYSQLSPADQKTFLTTFTNGANQNLIPTSFGAGSAFAMALGIGDTGSANQGKVQGANGQWYVLSGGSWVQTTSPTADASGLSAANVNTVMYDGSAEMNSQINKITLTPTQISQAETNGVTPGSALAFMLGLGDQSSATITNPYGQTWTLNKAGNYVLNTPTPRPGHPNPYTNPASGNTNCAGCSFYRASNY